MVQNNELVGERLSRDPEDREQNQGQAININNDYGDFDMQARIEVDIDFQQASSYSSDWRNFEVEIESKEEDEEALDNFLKDVFIDLKTDPLQVNFSASNTDKQRESLEMEDSEKY